MNPGEGPFHDGEIALQTRAGVRERLRDMKFIRDFMPDPHRELFAKLPTLLVGGLDHARRPWASIVFGPPGFLQSPDPRHLAIGALPLDGDPLRTSLAVDAPVGLLGIEPHTRRRNRMNGTVTEVTARGFAVEVDQSFGNCPQYIQARTPLVMARGATGLPEVGGPRLDARARGLARNADTFFIATAAARARGHAGPQGVDVSHRGGKRGFVRLGEEDGRTVLTVPDFRGNFFFNTLGNILDYPRAGMLFLDYDRGDVLQVTGSAEIVFDENEVRAYAGALRLLRVRVEESRWFAAALPLAWTAPDYAPQLAATGSWI